MPARKMRVELFDSEGNRYTIAFEGQVTRDKAVKLMDLVELLGGMPGDAPNASSSNSQVQENSSRFEKVRSIVQKSFPMVWFSSKDVQSVYEQELKEPVSLSTVSTYLSRMASKGFLIRNGAANNLKYKVLATNPQAVIKQKIK